MNEWMDGSVDGWVGEFSESSECWVHALEGSHPPQVQNNKCVPFDEDVVTKVEYLNRISSDNKNKDWCAWPRCGMRLLFQHLCTDMCMELFIAMCLDMCLDMQFNFSVDMCLDMCMDMCV